MAGAGVAATVTFLGEMPWRSASRSLGLLAAVPVFHATAPDPALLYPGGGGCQERSGYPDDCPGG